MAAVEFVAIVWYRCPDCAARSGPTPDVEHALNCQEPELERFDVYRLRVKNEQAKPEQFRVIWLPSHIGLAVREGQVWRRANGEPGIVVAIDETAGEIRLCPARRRHVGLGELVWEAAGDKEMVATPRRLDKLTLLHDPV